MAQITGSASADMLVGTTASDVFRAGAGHDVIVFDGRGAQGQTDVVVDFGSVYFGGPITGAQEVPAVNSAASGSFSGWLNRSQTEFNFTASIAGLDLGGQTAATTDNVSAAHFHAGPAGTSGGVVFGFIGAPNNEAKGETVVEAANGVVVGSWDLAEGNNTTLGAQLANLLSNRIYINFHTPVAPAGEIRGQANMLDGGLDRIDVSGLGIGDFATLRSLMTESGGSTTISVAYNGQVNALVLQGAPIANLSAADFIFASSAGGSSVGSNGTDDLFGAAGSDTVLGAGGGDRINAGAGADLVDGGEGADTILGLDGMDSVHGGASGDDVNGNLGEDWVFGEDGADTVRGGQGNDTIDGGVGADAHVNGNIGNDLVMGGEENDTVYGGRDSDTLQGQSGDDWLSGDLGNDIMFGGVGADRFLFRAGSGIDWVGDFNAAEGDRIQLATGTAFTVASVQGQAVVTLSGGDAIGLAGVGASSFSAGWIVFV
jgi:Ca2+-binding RTX toxin-like protein